MPSAHVFLVDISRHIGEAQPLISAVLRQMQTFAGANAIWYARANQTLPAGATTLPGLDGEQPAATISRYIRENSAAGSVFHVLSYDRFVLQGANALNSESAVVIPTHIRAFAFPEGAVSDGTAVSKTLPTATGHVGSGPLTHEEGVELAKQVLRDANHTSESTPLFQSKLRSAMGPRARKNPFDPSSNFLIKGIVQDGITKGWLKQKGESGSEVIWLADGVPVPPAPNPQPIAEPSKIPAEQPKDVPKPPTRASLMEACLRARGIGSPPAVRPLFFDAIQDIMSKKGTAVLSASQLLRQSREQIANHWSPNEAGKKTPNWEAISVCVLNMLLASGVLIGADDAPLNAAIGGQSGNVVKLHPDFRNQSEAYLVYYIIKKMGDVTISDKTNIGLALYQRGGGKDKVPIEDLLGNVDTLLALLKKEGKIDVEDDRFVVLP